MPSAKYFRGLIVTLLACLVAGPVQASSIFLFSNNFEMYQSRDLRYAVGSETVRFTFDWAMVKTPVNLSPNCAKNLDGEWYFDSEAQPSIGIVPAQRYGVSFKSVNAEFFPLSQR
ncbi:MAG: hypothetical protein R3296_12070 [Oleiphilaceae bacterium]|nr:hypothetical protein [Oleiphilaceae bacterium]